jgi:hypothetical protein
MLHLRNCSKDKRDPEQIDAKSILQKIETDSKLSGNDEKWIKEFQKKHFLKPNALFDDDDPYQIDHGDMLPAEKAIAICNQYDEMEPYDQQSRDSYFTVDTVEDISAESVKKADLLRRELSRVLGEGADQGRPSNTALMTDLLEKIKAEEQIQKKNTSVHVYSLSFQTIRESKPLQNLVVRCERILLRQFFHAHFLPGQLQSIICGLTKACDCVVSMRTGGGKTMIFAIPALLEDQKTTIVFSPLRSLILDQMNEMKKLGIEAGMQILSLCFFRF